MANLVCSKCGKELFTDAAMSEPSGGLGIMSGGTLNDMMEKMMKQPRACTSCHKNYCTACAMKAAKSNERKDNAFYACPDCGIKLGDSGDRPTLL